jgi:hypothetical protein
VDQRIPESFEPAQAELDYLGGINRLPDPAPIKLLVSEAGVEVTEVMPGSRRVLISREALIDAVLVDASTIASHERRAWRSRFKLRRSSPRFQQKVQDYRLTIRYQEDGEVRAATFRRQDSHGLTMINAVARSVTTLVAIRNS